MKIDEACINHNAVRLINEIVGSPYEYGDQDETADHFRLMTLGAVRGVHHADARHGRQER